MFSPKDQACIVGIGNTPFARASDAEPHKFTLPKFRRTTA